MPVGPILQESPLSPIPDFGQIKESDLDRPDGDFIEEKTLANGEHIKKEIHKGPGFETIEITTDGGPGVVGSPDDMLPLAPISMGPPPELMQQMIHDMKMMDPNMKPGTAHAIHLHGDGNGHITETIEEVPLAEVLPPPPIIEVVQPPQVAPEVKKDEKKEEKPKD